jgi:chromosome partitioning protein
MWGDIFFLVCYQRGNKNNTLTNNISGESIMAQVITIAQQKGGAGKTTVAAHLAVTLAQRGQRVAVVDIDPQGSLTQWHKLREKRFGEGYTGMSFVGVSGWRVGSEVARLKRNHDVIIVDSPPHTETEARTAIRNADLIIIPVQPSPTDLWATRATLDLALAEKVPVKVVMNRVPANSRLAETIAKELTHLSGTVLGNRALFASALLEGCGVTEMAPSSPAALEIKSLAGELLKIIRKNEQPEEEETTPTQTQAEPA